MLLLTITCKILQSGFLLSFAYFLKLVFVLTFISGYTASCLCFSGFAYAIDLSVCCSSEITCLNLYTGIYCIFHFSET